jgi:hypothetical protein
VVLKLGGWTGGKQLPTLKNQHVTWNTRSLRKSGSWKKVKREMPEYKLDLVGVQEVRWEKRGTEPPDDSTIIGIMIIT